MNKVLFTVFGLTCLLVCTLKSFSQSEHQFKLDRESTALLIIDIQYFYFPGGSLPLFEPEKASGNASAILKLFREKNMPVVHVRHNARSGAEIHSDVEPIDGEKLISKNEANSFNGTDLQDYLMEKGIKNLVIVGMQTHMCVEAATRAAYDLGFNCTVIEDACTTRDLKYGESIISAEDVHLSTLSSLSGTYADVRTTTELLKFLGKL